MEVLEYPANFMVVAGRSICLRNSLTMRLTAGVESLVFLRLNVRLLYQFLALSPALSTFFEVSHDVISEGSSGGHFGIADDRNPKYC